MTKLEWTRTEVETFATWTASANGVSAKVEEPMVAIGIVTWDVSNHAVRQRDFYAEGRSPTADDAKLDAEMIYECAVRIAWRYKLEVGSMWRINIDDERHARVRSIEKEFDRVDYILLDAGHYVGGACSAKQFISMFTPIEPGQCAACDRIRAGNSPQGLCHVVIGDSR